MLYIKDLTLTPTLGSSKGDMLPFHTETLTETLPGGTGCENAPNELERIYDPGLPPRQTKPSVPIRGEHICQGSLVLCYTCVRAIHTHKHTLHD